MDSKLTNQIESDEQAAELASIREQVALIQHQINNPLAVVLGNIQFLLLKSEQLDSKLVDRLRVVEKAALKIAEVNQQHTEITKTSPNDRTKSPA